VKPAPAAFVIVSLFIGLAGCGQPVPVFQVRGTVAVQGQPLGSGTVVFHPTDNSSSPIKTEIRPDGTYELSAPAGEYKLTAAFTVPGHGVEGVDKDYRPAVLQTPAKYIRLDETPLTATVQPHDDNVVNLSLTP
jgi:hypothetical protein